MATPAELAFERTNLNEQQLGHLQRLLGTWGILADFSFSDLVLLAPMAMVPGERPGEETELVILGQMRPSNSATVVQHDLVGQTLTTAEWPLPVLTMESGEMTQLLLVEVGALEGELGGGGHGQLRSGPVRPGRAARRARRRAGGRGSPGDR